MRPIRKSISTRVKISEQLANELRGYNFLKIGKKKACRAVQTRELKMKGKDVETGGLLNNKSLPLYVSPHPNQAEVAVGIFNQPTNSRLYWGAKQLLY